MGLLPLLRISGKDKRLSSGLFMGSVSMVDHFQPLLSSGLSLLCNTSDSSVLLAVTVLSSPGRHGEKKDTQNSSMRSLLIIGMLGTPLTGLCFWTWGFLRAIRREGSPRPFARTHITHLQNLPSAT